MNDHTDMKGIEIRATRYFRMQASPKKCKKVEASFEEVENPFTVLYSEYKQSKLLTDRKLCVFGSRFDIRINKKTGVYDQVV